MKGWCKIVEFEDSDILIQRKSNDDDGEHVIITVPFDFGAADLKLCYEDDSKKADAFFESLDHEKTLNIVGDVYNQVGVDLPKIKE